MAQKIHVLQMIGEFTSGGAETVVTTLARSLDNSPFSLYFTARKNGPVSQELPNPSRLVIIPKKNGFDFSHVRQLVQLIKEKQIDLVHSHLFGPNLFGFLAANLTGARIIQTIHGRDCLVTKKRVACYRLMAPWAGQIVTVSELLEQEFRQKVKTSDVKVTTIHNGVSIDRFTQQIDKGEKIKSLGLPSGSRIIGAVGNIKPVKGYDILVESFRKLLDRGISDVILLIVGEIFPKQEGYKRNLDRFIKNNGLQDKVIFLGYRQDVREILQILDIYVMASRSEGLSISLLEAMAAGNPVVATDVGMNSRVIQNEVNGLITPSEDIGALADALGRLLDDQDLSRGLGQKASETVRNHYTDEAMAQAYETLYRKVLTGRKRG